MGNENVLSVELRPYPNWIDYYDNNYFKISTYS